MTAMSEKLSKNQVCFGGTFASAVTKGILELLPGYELSSSSSSSCSSLSSPSSLSSSSSYSTYPPDINLSVLFPSMYRQFCPQYQLREYSCFVGAGIKAATTYIYTIYNPLPVHADLVAHSDGAFFDDDVEVDGVSLRGGCGTVSILTLPAGYVMKSNVPPGGAVTLTVVDLWGGYSGGSGGADWIAH